MNDAYDDDAVGWDSLVGYPAPNVTIPVSYEAFVEEWNSEMVYVFDRQGDVATITQTCSVVKNLVEYDVVVGDRLVVEPKLGYAYTIRKQKGDRARPGYRPIPFIPSPI